MGRGNKNTGKAVEAGGLSVELQCVRAGTTPRTSERDSGCRIACVRVTQSYLAFKVYGVEFHFAEAGEAARAYP